MNRGLKLWIVLLLCFAAAACGATIQNIPAYPSAEKPGPEPSSLPSIPKLAAPSYGGGLKLGEPLPRLSPPPVSAPTPQTLPRSPIENSTVNPRTGDIYPGTAGGVINPQTGDFLPKVPGGYINPRSGEFIPGR